MLTEHISSLGLERISRYPDIHLGGVQEIVPQFFRSYHELQTPIGVAQQLLPSKALSFTVHNFSGKGVQFWSISREAGLEIGSIK